MKNTKVFLSSMIATPLGDMIAIADDNYLYALLFADQSNKDRIIAALEHTFYAGVVSGYSTITALITQELDAYFKGILHHFTTPLFIFGTDFQSHVWKGLSHIPYGHTRSYVDQASFLQCYRAQRAIGNAHKVNPFVIILPCHRVIRSTGELGGYNGGIDRKLWLLEHEKKNRYAHR